MSLASATQTSVTNETLITGDKELVTHPKTVKSGEGVVPKLSVMGIVTATGEARLSKTANGDGSEVADHILIHEVDATAAAAEGPAYVEGCFNPDLLNIGTGHTVASIEQSLRQRGIHLRKPG